MPRVTWLTRGGTWLLHGSVLKGPSASAGLCCKEQLLRCSSEGSPLTCPHRKGSLVQDRAQGSSVALLTTCVCCIIIADSCLHPRWEAALQACFPYWPQASVCLRDSKLKATTEGGERDFSVRCPGFAGIVVNYAIVWI